MSKLRSTELRVEIIAHKAFLNSDYVSVLAQVIEAGGDSQGAFVTDYILSLVPKSQLDAHTSLPIIAIDSMECVRVPIALSNQKALSLISAYGFAGFCIITRADIKAKQNIIIFADQNAEFDEINLALAEISIMQDAKIVLEGKDQSEIKHDGSIEALYDVIIIPDHYITAAMIPYIRSLMGFKSKLLIYKTTSSISRGLDPVIIQQLCVDNMDLIYCDWLGLFLNQRAQFYQQISMVVDRIHNLPTLYHQTDRQVNPDHIILDDL